MKTMNFSALLLVISCLTALPACSDYKNSKTSETASKDLHDESMAEWRITRSEESLADKKSAGDTSRQGKEILIKAIKFTEDDLDISQVSYLELCSPKKCIKTQKKRNNIDSVDNIKGRANEIGRVFVDNGLVEIKTIRLHKTNPGSPVISSTIYPSINLEAIPDTFEVVSPEQLRNPPIILPLNGLLSSGLKPEPTGLALRSTAYNVISARSGSISRTKARIDSKMKAQKRRSRRCSRRSSSRMLCPAPHSTA